MITQRVLGQAGNWESRAGLRAPDCAGLGAGGPSRVEKARPPLDPEGRVWAEPCQAPW